MLYIIVVSCVLLVGITFAMQKQQLRRRSRTLFIVISVIIIFAFLTFVFGYKDDGIYDSTISNLELQKHFPKETPASPIANINAASNNMPEWKMLDSRPLPGWYDEAKFGIFIHWGVFSVPSVSSEWFWYKWKTENDKETLHLMEQSYKKGFSYAEFAPQFTAEFFDPQKWAELFEASGARYVVLTSKHHEGYTLWPSKYSWNWNSLDVGPHRDIVGELSSAIRARDAGIKFGVYYSLYEWFNPLYMTDKNNQFKTNDYIKRKMLPELVDVVMHYKPDIVWADGSWEASHTYWNSTGYLHWLYNYSPVKETVVTNDRWGSEVRCKHGGFFTCQDNYNPGSVQSRKWENCMTIDRKSWGYRRNADLSEYKSIEELVEEFIATISYGGNLLMNIGPTHDGMISPIYEERLRQMGRWLAVNGEAVYGSRMWRVQKDAGNPHAWYVSSSSGAYIYCLFTKWPAEGRLSLSSVTSADLAEGGRITLLGESRPLAQDPGGPGLSINLNQQPVSPELLRQPAWVIRMEASHGKH